MSNAKTSAKSTNGEALPKNGAKEVKNTAPQQKQEQPQDLNIELQALTAEADEWKAKAEQLLKDNEAVKAEKEQAEKTALELAKARKEAEQHAKKVTEQHAKDALYIASLEAKKPMTVQEAIEKGKSLAALTNKLDLLVNKKLEIKAFKFGGGEHSNEALKLTNSNGGTFSTTNSSVLDEVKRMVLARIEKAITETEAEIIAIG